MASDEVIGMPVDELLKLDREFVLDLLGIDISATRMKCALLTLEGAQERRARPRRRLGDRDPGQRRRDQRLGPARDRSLDGHGGLGPRAHEVPVHRAQDAGQALGARGDRALAQRARALGERR